MVPEVGLGRSPVTFHTKEGRFNTISTDPDKQGTDNKFPGLSFKRFFNELKIELPYNSAVSLSVYPMDSKSNHTDTCTSMFIAVLSKIDEIWNQPRDLVTGE